MDSLMQRYEYLTSQGVSQRAISTATGISRSTLQRWVAGESRLNQEAQKAMRNIYQRTVYSTMRQQGASVELARRASWQVPKTAVKQVTEFGGIVERLTRSAMLPEMRKLTAMGIDYDVEQLYQKYGDYVRGWMSSSDDTLGTIKDRYGK